LGVGSAAPNQLQAAEARVEHAIAVPVPVGLAIGAPLVPPGADQAFHVGLHEQLHHGLGHRAQEVAVAGFGQQLGQR
jgi:hypothetical protein